MSRPLIDLTGLVFGRLTVLGVDSVDAHNQKHWICQCACGNEHVARGDSLRYGRTQSCGCLRKEIRREAMLGVMARKHEAWRLLPEMVEATREVLRLSDRKTAEWDRARAVLKQLEALV